MMTEMETINYFMKVMRARKEVLMKNRRLYYDMILARIVLHFLASEVLRLAVRDSKP